MQKTDLSKFDNSWYNPGNLFKRGLWFFVNVCVMQNRMNPFSRTRVFFL